MILWRTFIFSQVETNSLLPGSNSTWYLLLSNGCNPSITFLRNSTPPWYVTINNSMHCVWRICFVSIDQMHNKILWTRFLFKHGSWCVSFTCLSFCSCKMTSQTVEEKTLTIPIGYAIIVHNWKLQKRHHPISLYVAISSRLGGWCPNHTLVHGTRHSRWPPTLTEPPGFM